MRVYHFLNKTYGIEALEKRRLRISRIGGLNDPFELLGAELSNPELRRAFSETKEILGQDSGLLCFSKRWRNPVLWSHYADRHRGFCLGFDVPDEHLIEVIYTTKRTAPDLLFSDDESVRVDLMKRLIATKFSHWRYESEVRCFVRLDDVDADSGHYFCDFSDKLKLTQVLVGSESNVSRNDLEKALGKDNAHVERFKTRAAYKTFNVVQNRKRSLWV